MEMLEGGNIEVIIVDPEIEIWMGYTKGASNKFRPGEIHRRAMNIDTCDLAAKDEEFRRLVQFLKA
ncbi:hypothetical protein ACH40F_57945 [Streptomyces sp. NPDC020794]|uniref:hypothetical protein n=1 Tax=unclassified Streptomyces TaxID=2593676 RepID=UPI0036F0DBDC